MSLVDASSRIGTSTSNRVSGVDSTARRCSSAGPRVWEVLQNVEQRDHVDRFVESEVLEVRRMKLGVRGATSGEGAIDGGLIDIDPDAPDAPRELEQEPAIRATDVQHGRAIAEQIPLAHPSDLLIEAPRQHVIGLARLVGEDPEAVGREAGVGEEGQATLALADIEAVPLRQDVGVRRTERRETEPPSASEYPCRPGRVDRWQGPVTSCCQKTCPRLPTSRLAKTDLGGRGTTRSVDSRHSSPRGVVAACQGNGPARFWGVLAPPARLAYTSFLASHGCSDIDSPGTQGPDAPDPTCRLEGHLLNACPTW